MLTAVSFGRTRPAAHRPAAHRPIAHRPIALSLLALNLIFILILNPSGILRYNSTGLTAEPAQMQTQHNFGDQAILIGIDGGVDTAVSPNTQLPITLYWKAVSEMDINYQIFVHVLKPDGTLLTQSDKLNPGEFPTKRWPLDKYVRDEHILAIPADAPPGIYTVSVGLWVQTEGGACPFLTHQASKLEIASRSLRLR